MGILFLPFLFPLFLLLAMKLQILKLKSVRRSLQPYGQLMRLSHPIGSQLLFLPCSWSILLAAPDTTCIPVLATFAVGSFVMRGNFGLFIWELINPSKYSLGE
jgi:hypothetical protein